MNTLQSLLDIQLPIIQAPMAGVQTSALAVAVSNAGGLGSLPCAMLTLDSLRAALRANTAGSNHEPPLVTYQCGLAEVDGLPSRFAYRWEVVQ